LLSRIGNTAAGELAASSEVKSSIDAGDASMEPAFNLVLRAVRVCGAVESTWI